MSSQLLCSPLWLIKRMTFVWGVDIILNTIGVKSWFFSVGENHFFFDHRVAGGGDGSQLSRFMPLNKLLAFTNTNPLTLCNLHDVNPTVHDNISQHALWSPLNPKVSSGGSDCNGGSRVHLSGTTCNFSCGNAQADVGVPYQGFCLSVAQKNRPS